MMTSSRVDTPTGPAAPGVTRRDGVAHAYGGKVDATRSAAHPATLQSIVDTLLIAERLMVTFYYAALTSPALMHDPRLGGPSADPNNPGLPPGGNPSHVRYLQAALDAEVKHATALAATGAVSPYQRFYFPASSFERVGNSVSQTSFLGMMEILERLCVAAYATAVDQFVALGRADLAGVAAALMGVEAEHRALGRVIAAIRPANNLTLEQEPFAGLDALRAALDPFLTGRRYLFASDTVRAALPAPAQTVRVIGGHGTRQVHNFLLLGGG